MKGNNLGEFEELILLTVAALHGGAYGLAIQKTLAAETERKVTLSAVHAACNRLQDKGFLSAEFGAATARRGGKRKKLYTVTVRGQEALHEAQALRMRLWRRIPPGNLQIDVSW